MARMSIDDSVQRDPRITKLAQLAGWSRRETVGCLVSDVWPITYDQKTPIVSADLVDLAAGAPGFAQHMVDAELARWVRGNRRVRIAGAEERLKYLADKSVAGRVGGRKSAEVRAKTSSSAGASAQAARNPPVPDVVPDPVPAPVPDPAHRQKQKGSAPPDPARGKLRQNVIDEFHTYFVTLTGAKPTWGKAQLGMVDTLIDKHGAHEVLRRIANLRDRPPNFPPQPWDMRTFVQHFDRLAGAASTPTTGRIEPKPAEAYGNGELAL